MKQLVVIQPNRPGLLADVSEIVGAAGVNIEAIESEHVGEMGVVRMNVDQYDQALRALHEAGLRPLSEEVVLVRLDDKPGALAGLARRFKDANLDIRSLLLVHRDGSQAIAAITAEDPNAARELVRDALVG